jgi:hypothetical protein
LSIKRTVIENKKKGTIRRNYVVSWGCLSVEGCVIEAIIIMTAEESGVVAALSSFLATYIAGALHPLDIIKTRFQSTPASI